MANISQDERISPETASTTCCSIRVSREAGSGRPTTRREIR
jgi:hypothetical protein